MTEAVAVDRLRSFIERIENLEYEKKETAELISDVYAELKGEGYDPKIVRKVVSIRRMDEAERKEMEAVLDLYLSALGLE